MRGCNVKRFGYLCNAFVVAFCICMCSGCGDMSPTSSSSPQRDCRGLQFRLRRLPAKGDKGNLVQFVEVIENTSQCSLEVDVRSTWRGLSQIKPAHLYPAEEICRSFPGGQSAELGDFRTLRPSETLEIGSASFTIQRAGLYHLQSTLSAYVRPSGAIDINMKKCDIPANDLEITVTNDLAEKRTTEVND
jgi:hypothetical protein